jgi:hypothetical protein
MMIKHAMKSEEMLVLVCYVVVDEMEGGEEGDLDWGTYLL